MKTNDRARCVCVRVCVSSSSSLLSSLYHLIQPYSIFSFFFCLPSTLFNSSFLITPSHLLFTSLSCVFLHCFCTFQHKIGETLLYWFLKKDVIDYKFKLFVNWSFYLLNVFHIAGWFYDGQLCIPDWGMSFLVFRGCSIIQDLCENGMFEVKLRQNAHRFGQSSHPVLCSDPSRGRCGRNLVAEILVWLVSADPEQGPSAAHPDHKPQLMVSETGSHGAQFLWQKLFARQESRQIFDQ